MNVPVLDRDSKSIIRMVVVSEDVLAVRAKAMFKLQVVKCDEVSIENMADS